MQDRLALTAALANLTLDDVERIADAAGLDGGLLAVALRPSTLHKDGVVHLERLGDLLQRLQVHLPLAAEVPA